MQFNLFNKKDLNTQTLKHSNTSSGFTLIELVLVITILGIIAISALPSFTSVTTEAEISSRDTVLGAVQTGLQLYRANDMALNGPPGTYPTELDATVSGSPCASSSPCFGNILQMAIGDYRNGRGWFKVSATNYTFNDGSTSYSYLYDISNGTFTLQ